MTYLFHFVGKLAADATPKWP